MAGSAPQQATNGTYRTVELLNLWATDKGLDAASIMSDFRMQDIMAGVPADNKWNLSDG